MFVERPVAACLIGTRPTLGYGESIVIIVIITMGALLAVVGMPLPEEAVVLTGTSLLAVAVIRLGRVRTSRRTRTRLDRAGHALLALGQA